MDRQTHPFRLAGWLSLFVAVAASAWRFGAAQSLDQFWLLSLLAVATVCHLCSFRSNLAEIPKVPAATWPILLAAVFAAIQLLPLPSALHEQVDSQGFQWWTTYSADQLQPQSNYTLTMSPGATRHDAAMLGLGVCAFLLASFNGFDRRFVIWTLVFAMLNGAALALFGIVQSLTSDNLLFWSIRLPEGSLPFASFVNRNHAAGYLNLCLAAAIGCYVFLVSNSDTHHQNGNSNGNHRNDWQENFDNNSEWKLLSVGAICALLAAAVICSASRGGAVAAAVAFAVVVFASKQLRANKLFRILLTGIAIAGGGLAIWLGRGFYLQGRFRELWTGDGMPSNGRLAHWADAFSTFRDFWLTGTGIGTYRNAYRPYESSFAEGGWYYHAENQYIEALVEGGLIGLALLLAALFFAYRAIQNRRSRTDAVSLAIGTAGLFAITAQAVHSCFDFGLYLPANAMLFGTIVGCAGVSSDSSKGKVVSWTLLVVVLVAWTSWGAKEMTSYAKLELTQKSFERIMTELPDKQSDFAEEFQNLEVERSSVDSSLLAADVELKRYQIAAYNELVRQMPTGDKTLLWRLSDARVLHQRVHGLMRENNLDALNSLRANPQVKKHLRAAYEHFLTARKAGPLLPESHIGLAQLGVIFGDQARESSRLKSAESLAPFMPDVLFKIGLLDLQAGRAESGFQRWTRCLQLSPRFIDEVMLISSKVISTSELIENVLPRKAERLVEIADRYFASDEAAETRVRLANMAAEAIESDTSLGSKQKMALDANISRLQGKLEVAIEKLTAVVAIAPNDVGSRFELARLLLKANRLSEALHHATICQRLAPKPRKHAALLQSIRSDMRKQIER